MYGNIKQIHLIGMGGIGMSGIAELLLRHGYHVSGSDMKMNDTLKQLESRGARVFIGHQASQIEGADLVVYSSAVQSTNPEMQAAAEKQIPIIPRAEMLAELMRIRYGIAVAGAHGKTTTTSMVALILLEAGLDPTIVVGGRVDGFGGTNARLGTGNFMVVEADESDGSFNKLSPSIAIVTNIDREHMDHYKTMANVKKAYLAFLEKVPFYGLCVVCGDDPYLRMLMPRVSRRKKTYGFSAGNHYQITDYSPTATGAKSLVLHNNHSFTLTLNVPGKHNMLNALAGLVVADELSVPREKTLQALEKFSGVQRRFQKRGEINGVHLIDDYAHHPSEIKATLAAARERFPKSRIRVVFQPHRYSRVEDLFDEFSTCFRKCDSVSVTDIYAAGESPIPGIHSQFLSESISKGDVAARYISKPSEAFQECLQESAPGDIILTLGAGDLPNVYKDLLPS